MELAGFFEQQQSLKKKLLSEVCTLAFASIKDRVNMLQEKYTKKLTEKQVDNKPTEQKAAIYDLYFGKYLQDKGIARDVQKHIARNKVILDAEIHLFNALSLEYRNLKQQVKALDDKIEAQSKIKMNEQAAIDTQALCHEVFDYGTIETDVR